MTRLRSFLAGLLLVPVLTLNASPLGTDADRSSLEPTHQVLEWCWVNWGGLWFVVPC